MANAALGLTLEEAERVFFKAIIRDAKLAGEEVQFVREEKRQIVQKSGLLEYCETSEDLGRGRRAGPAEGAGSSSARAPIEPAARDYGLPPPKGLLLLGVQGCGKSLAAKAVSGSWGFPLLRLDLSRIFGSLIGSSEEHMRHALEMAESVSPAVLWVDEIEKTFSGIESSGMSDAGTTARVFGYFLTWLQDKTAPVFCVATANSIERLPPELLRKGRFDDIFFVDLPSAQERMEIARIHLAKRKRDPAQFDLAAARGAVGRIQRRGDRAGNPLGHVRGVRRKPRSRAGRHPPWRCGAPCRSPSRCAKRSRPFGNGPKTARGRPPRIERGDFAQGNLTKG